MRSFNRFLDWRVLDQRRLAVSTGQGARRSEVCPMLDDKGLPERFKANDRPRLAGRSLEPTFLVWPLPELSVARRPADPCKRRGRLAPARRAVRLRGGVTLRGEIATVRSVRSGEIAGVRTDVVSWRGNVALVEHRRLTRLG
jgi:hypothetical protein